MLDDLAKQVMIFVGLVGAFIAGFIGLITRHTHEDETNIFAIGNFPIGRKIMQRLKLHFDSFPQMAFQKIDSVQ